MTPTQQGSSFSDAIDRYLHRQRTLGRGYVHEEHVFDALRRFLRENGCELPPDEWTPRVSS